MALLLFEALAAPAATEATAPLWRVDAAHSALEFTATQAGAEFDGRFRKFTAEIRFDPAALAGSRFVVSIDTRSVATHDEERDAALTGSDFFASDRWPEARFETTAFTAKGTGRFEARGRLTIRDVTRDILLPITFSQRPADGTATLAGGTTIRRLDFGVGQGEWTDTKWVGNDVRIKFELRLAAARASD